MSLEVRKLWAVYKPAVFGDSQPDLFFDRAQAEGHAVFRDAFLEGHVYTGSVEEVVAVMVCAGRALVLGRVGDALEVRT